MTNKPRRNRHMSRFSQQMAPENILPKEYRPVTFSLIKLEAKRIVLLAIACASTTPIDVKEQGEFTCYAWGKKLMIEIPKDKIEDVNFDIWGSVRPLVIEAFGGERTAR